MMKVSDILKKIGYIKDADIWIEFRERTDAEGKEPEYERINEDTPQSVTDRIIERAAGYTVREINIDGNSVLISGIRAAKRTPKPTPEQAEEKRAKQEQAIAEEWERLEQAVDRLIETIIAPVRQIGKRAAEGRVAAAIKAARAAVRRILKRIFRKDRGKRNEHRGTN